MNSRKVSVIVITKDRPDSLERCLKSIKSQSYRKFEIVVVATGDAESKKICRKYKAAYVEEKKLGRCLARNTGIRKSKGDIIIFFDDDTEADKGAVKNFIKSMGKDVGAVCGMEVSGVRRGAVLNTVQKIKMAALADLNPFMHMKKTEVRRSGRVTGAFREDFGISQVGHIKGMAMAFSRKALESIGGFDEKFTGTAHREDTDISVRIAKKGYKILYNPKIKIRHYVEGSGREDRFKFMYNNYKQHQYFVFKNDLVSWSGIPEYILGEVLEIIAIPVHILYEKDLKYLKLLKAKIEGISEGVKAKHEKSVYGDMR